MTWTTWHCYIPQYEYVSTNQYGDRFKRKASKKLNIARLSCKCNDVTDLTHLVLLSHHLNVPVHYDFKDQEAYIEIMSGDAVRGKL